MKTPSDPKPVAVVVAHLGEYVELFDSFDGESDWMLRAAIPGAVAKMAELGWTVSIRATRSGEAEGTYRVRRDGFLQILGYALPVPDGYAEDFATATEAAHDALAPAVTVGA